MAYNDNQIIEKTFVKFNPKSYLNEYYLNIGEENYFLLKFFAETYRNIPENSYLLEFGGGPTIYQLLSAAGRIKEIHFSDYLQSNLDEVKKWQEKDKNAFDWRDFTKTSLKLEGYNNVTKDDIIFREQQLRSKITKFLLCNAFSSNPITSSERGKYDVVSVNFVPESISKNKTQWNKIMKNICTLIKPGGFLIMNALKGADYWQAGERKFPAAHINEIDIRKILNKLGFIADTIKIKSSPAEAVKDKGTGSQGFEGILSVTAKRKF